LEELEHGGEITLETLGLMIGKGFAHNDKRFDAIESRLGKIEHLLLAKQEQRINDLEAHLKKLEDALAVLASLKEPPGNGGFWLPSCVFSPTAESSVSANSSAYMHCPGSRTSTHFPSMSRKQKNAGGFPTVLTV
jgi:hypothetical protein